MRISRYFTFIFTISTCACFSQTNESVKLELKDAVEYALQHNENIQYDKLEVSYQQQMKKTSGEIPKTAITYTQGQFNSAYRLDNNVTVMQTVPFPTYFGAHKSLHESSIKSGQYKLDADKEELTLQVKAAYYSLLYCYSLEKLLAREDSIYESFASKVQLKYEQGGNNLLEKMESEAKVLEIKNKIMDNRLEISNLQVQLKTLLNHGKTVDVVLQDIRLAPLSIAADSAGLQNHPHLRFLLQEAACKKEEKRLEVNKALPDLIVGYFNLSIYGPANFGQGDYFLTTANRMQGFTVGLNAPLWFHPFQAKVKAAEIKGKAAETNYRYGVDVFEGEFRQTFLRYQKVQQSIAYYRKSPFSNSSNIIDQAFRNYTDGGINYVEYLAIVSGALQTESNYLSALNENNQTVLKLQYLMAK